MYICFIDTITPDTATQFGGSTPGEGNAGSSRLRDGESGGNSRIRGNDSDGGVAACTHISGGIVCFRTQDMGTGGKRSAC